MAATAVAGTRAPTPAVPASLMAAVLVGGHAVKHMFNQGFLAMLPDIQNGMGLSNTAVGALSTARNVAGASSNLPAGFVADRYSRHWAPILAGSMVLIGVFHFLMGSVGSYVPLLLAAMVANAAVSFWHPPAIAALSHRFAERRGFAISLHGSGGSIGEAAGPVLVGALLLLMPWFVILQVSIVPALATALVVILLLRNMRGETVGNLTMRGYVYSLRHFLTHRRLLVLLLVGGGYSMTQSAINTFLPIYLRNELLLSPVETGVYLFAGQVAGIASSPALGHVSDRYGRRAVLVPALLLLGLSALAVSRVPAGPLLILSVGVMGAFMFPLMALFLAAAMDHVDVGVQATTVSMVYGVGSLFGAISPSVAGILSDTYGVQSAFNWAAGVAALSAALLALGAGRRRA